MNMTELLARQTEEVYRATAGLAALVQDDELGWRPQSGSNWMTTGQLLCHLQMACGLIGKCFVSGDWSTLDQFEMDESKRDPETGLYPSEALPTVASVASFQERLAADKQTMLDAIAGAGEARLQGDDSQAPWDPRPRKLGFSLQECLLHIGIHRAQLFYYLKLQGKPVHTGHMWGLESE